MLSGCGLLADHVPHLHHPPPPLSQTCHLACLFEALKQL
ncbi:hypothetical protein HBZS_115550 [Helicobacter bizzozeronii CCUG 35545]|nr:hypothetical protein HBZS_115550 [Helicobacter bizzozeronii CCUG 35545]